MRNHVPANLLQVSNSIFDPCFKAQLDHHIEKALGFEPIFMDNLLFTQWEMLLVKAVTGAGLVF